MEEGLEGAVPQIEEIREAEPAQQEPLQPVQLTDPVQPAPEQFVPDEQTRLATIAKSARKVYSRLAFGSIGALLIASLAAALLIIMIGLMSFGSFSDETGVGLVLAMSVVSTHLIALPVVMRIFRKMPVFHGEKEKLSAGDFAACIPICVFLAYGGDLLSTQINELLKNAIGIDSSSQTIALFDADVPILTVIVLIVLIGPLMEELFFRRMLIDRMRGYGERTAVVVSSVMFGLFHGNIVQFIYATLLGLVFGYIYVRTENIKITFALHAFVNLFCGTLPMAFQKYPAVTEFDEGLSFKTFSFSYLKQGMASPEVAWYVIYLAVIVLLSVIGLVLLIVKAKKVHFFEAPLQLPKGKRFTSAWLNPGMIAFVIVFMLLIFSVIKMM